MIPIDTALYSLVLVTWVDSNFVVGWRSAVESTAKLPKAQTAGFITALTEDLIEISGSLGTEGGKLNPLSIPRISIIEFEVLKSAEPVPVLLPEYIDHVHDLPETVESDAAFNFRKLQLEIK